MNRVNADGAGAINKNDILALVEKIFTEKLIVRYPSFGEYPVYDELFYASMRQDSVRLGAYQEVIHSLVPGKVVVEIGTGDESPLAVMCAEAGAARVYAIELNEASARRAQCFVESRGLSSRIKVIVGNALHVGLPENADICVSEIIGNIGGSEGAAHLLKNGKRFLSSDGMMIPERCVTRIAPATLPKHIYRTDFTDIVSKLFEKKIFDAMGAEFPITRFVYTNFPEDCLLSDSAVFENDNFNGELVTNFQKRLTFTVKHGCVFDGLLLWIQLHVGKGRVVDSLFESFWAPVFLSVESFNVESGDVIRVDCERRLGKNGVNPDYFFSGIIRRRGEIVHEFKMDSFHSFA